MRICIRVWSSNTVGVHQNMLQVVCETKCVYLACIEAKLYIL